MKLAFAYAPSEVLRARPDLARDERAVIICDEDPTLNFDFLPQNVLFANRLLTQQDESLDRDAQSLARDWFREPKAQSLLSFEGVNLGEMFHGELAYTLISILKLKRLLSRVRNLYPQPAEIFLMRDGSYWTKFLPLILKSQGIPFEWINGEQQMMRKTPNIFQARVYIWLFFKGILKTLASSWCSKSLPLEGILCSCSPKFGEGLWDKFRDVSFSYIRPEFSFRVSRRSRHVRQLYTAGPQMIATTQAASRMFNAEDTVEEIKALFSNRSPFVHEGEDLWPILGAGFLDSLRSRLRDFSVMVLFFQRELKRSLGKLKAVVVDEDTTPFNMALVRCASLFGIPSVQIQHGIVAHSLFLPVRSDKIAVMGAVSLKRLLEWGVEASKITVTGAIHLPEISSRDVPQTLLKKKSFFKKHGIPEGNQIAVLATHPLYSGQKSDWIANADHSESLYKSLKVVLDSLHERPSVHLVIKLHPRDRHEQTLKRFLSARYSDMRVVIERDISSLDLLSFAGVLFCGNSTVFCEALLVGCPAWVLDHGFNRKLTFMSRDYIDLDDPGESTRKIQAILDDPHQRADRLTRQKEELTSHFLNGNYGAALVFKKLLHELKPVVA